MHCILLFHLFIFLYAKSIVHFKNKRTSQKKNIVPLKRTSSGPVEGSTVWIHLLALSWCHSSRLFSPSILCSWKVDPAV